MEVLQTIMFFTSSFLWRSVDLTAPEAVIQLAREQKFGDIIQILSDANREDVRSWFFEGRNLNVETPLHSILPYHPTLEVVELIIQRMKSTMSSTPEDAIDVKGRTPLHIAVGEGCSLAVVRRLIVSDGQAVRIRDSLLRYPLHWACTNPRGISSLQHSRKTSIFSKLKLKSSAKTNHDVVNMIEIISLLVLAYPNAVIWRDRLGMTPLDIAIDNNASAAIVRMLENVIEVGVASFTATAESFATGKVQEKRQLSRKGSTECADLEAVIEQESQDNTESTHDESNNTDVTCAVEEVSIAKSTPSDFRMIQRKSNGLVSLSQHKAAASSLGLKTGRRRIVPATVTVFKPNLTNERKVINCHSLHIAKSPLLISIIRSLEAIQSDSRDDRGSDSKCIRSPDEDKPIVVKSPKMNCREFHVVKPDFTNRNEFTKSRSYHGTTSTKSGQNLYCNMHANPRQVLQKDPIARVPCLQRMESKFDYVTMSKKLAQIIQGSEANVAPINENVKRLHTDTRTRRHVIGESANNDTLSAGGASIMSRKANMSIRLDSRLLSSTTRHRTVHYCQYQPPGRHSGSLPSFLSIPSHRGHLLNDYEIDDENDAYLEPWEEVKFLNAMPEAARDLSRPHSSKALAMNLGRGTRSNHNSTPGYFC